MYRKLESWLGENDEATLLCIAGAVEWEVGRRNEGYYTASIKELDNSDTQRLVTRALGELSLYGNIPEGNYDAYLLHYPTGSFISEHTDSVLKENADKGMIHARLNALVQSGIGGVLSIDHIEKTVNQLDAYIFRPDIQLHSVSEIADGDRYVFSVGANLYPIESN